MLKPWKNTGKTIAYVGGIEVPPGQVRLVDEFWIPKGVPLVVDFTKGQSPSKSTGSLTEASGIDSTFDILLSKTVKEVNVRLKKINSIDMLIDLEKLEKNGQNRSTLLEDIEQRQTQIINDYSMELAKKSPDELAAILKSELSESKRFMIRQALTNV